MVRLMEGVCLMRIFRIPIYKMHLLLRNVSVLGSNGVLLIWVYEAV